MVLVIGKVVLSVLRSMDMYGLLPLWTPTTSIIATLETTIAQCSGNPTFKRKLVAPSVASKINYFVDLAIA